jgi:shikimate dehydrogenase
MKKQQSMFAVIGNPLGQSLSPLMHNAAFHAKKINAIYFALEAENARDAIGLMKLLGIRGYSVTIPFKEPALRQVDSIEPVAKKIGAINTIINKKGKLYGYNTDWLGAVKAIEEKITLKGKKTIVIGTGGAAKAVAFGLKERKAVVSIAGRNLKAARTLARKIRGKAIGLDSLDSLEGFDILVNATPAGMHPKEKGIPINPGLLHKGILVFDMVYNPLETRLLAEAKRKGCRTVSGERMFIEQGARQFELFTGKKAPKKIMEKIVLKDLKGRKR